MGKHCAGSNIAQAFIIMQRETRLLFAHYPDISDSLNLLFEYTRTIVLCVG